MDWKEYRQRFKYEVSKLSRTPEWLEGSNITPVEYTKYCLKYANHLYKKNLPIIYNQEHLSLIVGYKVSYLLGASNGQEHFYRRFRIPKKSGGHRVIDEPLPSLKEIQRWILDNILYRIEISNYAKAFRPNYTLKSNARFHTRQKQVLSLDIKDFFPSITFPKILNVFMKMGYAKDVAVLLSNLCTLDGKLPQGAPTSPALSNIVAKKLDSRIASYAIKRKLRFTRYADDITLSGEEFNVGETIKFVEYIIGKDDFVLNDAKTKLMKQNKRQEVTGITVNKKMNPHRDTVKELRKAIYYIDRYGLDSHMQKVDIRKRNYARHLFGIATWILFINPEQKDAIKAIEVLGDYLE